jgi:lipoprotein-anchoring transpeptidase ErfK/SrfK
VETTTGEGADPVVDPWREVVGSNALPPAKSAPGPRLVAPVHTAPVPIAPRPDMRPGPPGRRRSRRLETVLKAAVVVLAVAVIGAAVALVVVEHGHRHAPAGHRSIRSPRTLGAPPATTTSAPAPTTTVPPAASPAGAPVLSASSGGYLPSSVTDPSTVATADVASLPLYPAPGAAAPTGHLANPNWLGARLTLLVTAVQGPWVQAYVPVRPNESTAWFPAADVTLSSDPYHIQVSISAHELVLYKDNAPVFTSPVATGAPDSPTPTGSYFVAFIVKLTDPQDAYGPYALGTSAFSNTYYSFEGGPGQIGIHGTNQPWVIGTYASHGCIRLPNSAITTVATQIVPGTPVEIAP